MKKIILICIMIMMVGMNVTSAEIKSMVDEFSNAKQYYCNYSLKNDVSVSFLRIINDSPSFKIRFYKNTMTYDRHRKGNVDIKVDSQAIQKLEVIETNRANRGMYDNSGTFMWCVVTPEKELVQKMVNAERVAFKIYYENSPADIVVIPKEILEEWKEVSLKEK